MVSFLFLVIAVLCGYVILLKQENESLSFRLRETQITKERYKSEVRKRRRPVVKSGPMYGPGSGDFF